MKSKPILIALVLGIVALAVWYFVLRGKTVTAPAPGLYTQADLDAGIQAAVDNKDAEDKRQRNKDFVATVLTLGLSDAGKRLGIKWSL